MTSTPFRSIVIVVVLGVAIPLRTRSVLAGPGPRFVVAFETIDVPGAMLTTVNANSTHAIAGEFDDAAGAHGFVLRDGAFTQVDVPGASATILSGINARGHLTGIYFDSQGLPHGFIPRDDVISTFAPPDIDLLLRFLPQFQGPGRGLLR